MKTKRYALIAVDVQNDFLRQDYLEPSAKAMLEGLRHRSEMCDITIASRNLFPDNLSTLFVKGTKGAKIAPEIAELTDYIVTKGDDRAHYGYSAFEGRTLRPLRSLEDILKDEKVTNVWVAGYVLEFCVSRTAFDANALGYPTVVDCTATASWNDLYSDGYREALDKLQTAGVMIYG